LRRPPQAEAVRLVKKPVSPLKGLRAPSARFLGLFDSLMLERQAAARQQTATNYSHNCYP
jgi:hypothetical protein